MPLGSCLVRVHLVSLDSPPAGALSFSFSDGLCLPTDSPLFAAIIVGYRSG